MLTRLDDYLVHQTPETVDRVYTSDRNFYDRYYFSAHTLEGDAYLIVAMGVYPNVGVIDAFATAVIEGKTQYIVRASRELGSDRMNTKVGPIGVEIIEPLRKTMDDRHMAAVRTRLSDMRIVRWCIACTRDA